MLTSCASDKAAWPKALTGQVPMQRPQSVQMLMSMHTGFFSSSAREIAPKEHTSIHMEHPVQRSSLTITCVEMSLNPEEKRVLTLEAAAFACVILSLTFLGE